MSKKKQTVFVGLSGGVDSAVSAVLLKKQGYEVVGVFIKTWHPDFLKCNEEEERHDAMRVAASLDIPFLTFDFKDVYKKEVADYMISEYRVGKTPNPDVMCNKEIKFGAFLKNALKMGADFVATGHYSQVKSISAQDDFFLGPRFPGPLSQPDHSKKHFVPSLVKGADFSKDQSYFLWTLKQKQLSKIIFPVGHLKKTEVRKLAKKFNLPVAEKKDSQGICFLGAIDLKEFLKHYIKEKKGKVMLEKGEMIGWHNGVVFHTLGERHGFTITKKNPNDKPYYVVGKDIKKNILYVSEDSNRLIRANKRIVLSDVNWISDYPCQSDLDQCKSVFPYKCQIRYHGELLPCRIKIKSRNQTSVEFEQSVLASSGQSLVVYNKNICLGGGVIF